MRTTLNEAKEEVVRCRLIDDECSTPETRQELATARLLHDVIEEGTSMGVKELKEPPKHENCPCIVNPLPDGTNTVPVTVSYSEPISSVPEIPVIDLRPKKRKQMRRLLWWVIIVNVLVLISILLCSCKAVQGIGQDITWAGGAGEKFLEYREK